MKWGSWRISVENIPGKCVEKLSHTRVTKYTFVILALSTNNGIK